MAETRVLTWDLEQGTHTPTNSQYYGTDASGNKWFHDLPAGGWWPGFRQVVVTLAATPSISFQTITHNLWTNFGEQISRVHAYYMRWNTAVTPWAQYTVDTERVWPAWFSLSLRTPRSNNAWFTANQNFTNTLRAYTSNTNFSDYINIQNITADSFQLVTWPFSGDTYMGWFRSLYFIAA